VLRLRDGSDLVLVGEGYYREALRDRLFRVSAGSFFQVNTTQTEEMLDIVERAVEPEAEDILLDVYCGVGTIGLSMQDKVGHVIGLEEHPAAVYDAEANADHLDAVTLIEGRAETILPRLDERVTKAVVDPPRQGCQPQVIDALLGLAPRRLVYVSCNPSTLARDAALFVKGGYELVEVQPVDMFPQTHHVESVSLLVI
jgi:23S rRNA (uracil1939-C5)-methyltransferase